MYGRTYEYIYPEEGETDLTIKSLSPENTFMVYDDIIEQKELFAVYYYARKDDSDKKSTIILAIYGAMLGDPDAKDEDGKTAKEKIYSRWLHGRI